MKNYRSLLFKLLAAVLCLCLLVSFTACSSDDADNSSSSTADEPFGGLDMEFKYSEDCYNWTEVTDEAELFRADGKYAAGDVEAVYLHIKNHTTGTINYKINLKVESGNAGGAEFGYAFDVRSAYTNNAAALEAVKDSAKALGSGYVLSETVDADSSITFALVIYVPEGAAAADMKLKLDFKPIAVDTTGTDNASKTVDGKTLVYANAHTKVESTAADTVVANGDGSFKAIIKAGTIPQGSWVAATVKPNEAGAYNIAVTVDGVAFTGNMAVSLLAGYGYQNVEVYSGDTKLDAKYNMYGGLAEFNITSGGTYSVKASGAVDIKGVAVQGFDTTFKRFDEAVKYVAGQSADKVGETVNYIIFGKVNYLVAEGEEISFIGQNEQIKNINVIGGSADAEIILDEQCGSLPSLPYAELGNKITYSRLKFDSDKTTDIRHFDYRANADISFINCVFEQGVATRGPSSNVVVDGCTFNCTLSSDTFKGYCYYSVSIVGANKIKVQFTNNNVTGSWGGINLDWAAADFTVTGNTFSNITCSKPPIQLSRANTMLIENNKFTNIKDENALRFYSDYHPSSTIVRNNYFDTDYLFQSDRPNAINDLQDFVFENNTITSTTDLTLGHEANAPADQISPHGYVVDTNVNKIQ